MDADWLVQNYLAFQKLQNKPIPKFKPEYEYRFFVWNREWRYVTKFFDYIEAKKFFKEYISDWFRSPGAESRFKITRRKL